MNKDATFALEAGIYTWIDDNKNLVNIAQKLANKTVILGLCDTNTHNPFQIVPTDEFSSDGNLKHDLFLNIDHAAWGYFRINIKSDCNFEMIPPKMTLFDKNIFINEKEVKDFIDYLSSSLDSLYKLQELLENNKLKDSEILLNKMLIEYHNDVDDHLNHIKSYINTFPGDIYIKATNSDDKGLLDRNTRYDLALMHSENWFVKNYTGILNNESAQEELRLKILDFFITESQAASFLYVAQKIVKESSYRLIIHTDSLYPETDLTDEVLYDEALKITLVRPVLHATKIEILNNE